MGNKVNIGFLTTKRGGGRGRLYVVVSSLKYPANIVTDRTAISPRGGLSVG